MAAFINNSITAAGLAVLAKGVAGQPIKYTRIVLGDGYLEDGQTPRSLNGVIHPRAEVEITKLKLNFDGTVVVGGIFDNRDMEEGFFYRELGLYAEDPDPNVGEILYCYGNCGDRAEWIPPTGEATVLEKIIDIVTIIGTATNVSAYLSSQAYATKEDFESYLQMILDVGETANQALNFAQQVSERLDETNQSLISLENAVAQNTSKISTLWDAVFNDITTNPFQISFSDLDGITLSAGVWNAALQRLEC